MIFTEFDSTTGRLGGVHTSTYTDVEFLQAQIIAPGMDTLMPGMWEAGTHYVLDGEVTERPDSPVTLDGITLLNVPTGATVTIEDTAYAASGDVEMSFAMSGSYTVRVECFPYLDFTATVTV